MRAALKLAFGFALLGGLRLASAQTPTISPLDLQSFEKVWSTIRDSHWQKNPGGLDWDAIHAEFRPRIDHTTSSEEARAISQEMLSRLKQTHFGILPASIYSGVQAGTEDSGQSMGGAGTTGIDLRVLGGQAVVTSVDADSPAFRAGVRPGWIVASAAGQPLPPLIQQAQGNPEIHELQLTRSLMARLSGPMDTTVSATFVDGQDHTVPLTLALVRPRGQSATFGNLPTSSVWYEDKRLGSTAYLRFNIFLDIPRVMPDFQRTVNACMTGAAANNCNGLIIDLRGNPGGIGGMAMGMAGFLVDQANQRLGAMYMREATLNFVINPRPEVFEGPVAVLLDANSASTSEIFAGGLQDLHRARIFGSRSAAAALPSVFERLPNGDGFQYAIANYISQGGKALEGLGVTPDEQVSLTRAGLLAGNDAVVDAARAWIDKQKWPAGSKQTSVVAKE